jgi:hypothetical protein
MAERVGGMHGVRTQRLQLVVVSARLSRSASRPRAHFTASNQQRGSSLRTVFDAVLDPVQRRERRDS